MSDLSGRLAPVIHKALLANGVQLTGKELNPVSASISDYMKNNFEAVSKDVDADLAADKKVADEKAAAAKAVAEGNQGFVPTTTVNTQAPYQAEFVPAANPPSPQVQAATEPVGGWKQWRKNKK